MICDWLPNQRVGNVYSQRNPQEKKKKKKDI